MNNLVRAGGSTSSDFAVPPEWIECALLLARSGSPTKIAFVRATPEAALERQHRHAAIETMTAFRDRADCYFARLAKESGTERTDYFSIEIAPGNLKGAAISPAEFVGGGYSLESRAFTLKEMELMSLPDASRGLAYAVSTAPHGVEEREAVFARLLATIFGWFAGPVSIFQWSDDWSNYFDLGKEWWGAFFWTVLMPDRDVVVGIGASTTD